MPRNITLKLTEAGSNRFDRILERVNKDTRSLLPLTIACFDELSEAVVERGATIVIREQDGSETEHKLPWLCRNEKGLLLIN